MISLGLEAALRLGCCQDPLFTQHPSGKQPPCPPFANQHLAGNEASWAPL